MSSEQQNFHPKFGEGQIDDQEDILEVPFYKSGAARNTKDSETKPSSENPNNLL